MKSTAYLSSVAPCLRGIPCCWGLYSTLYPRSCAKQFNISIGEKWGPEIKIHYEILHSKCLYTKNSSIHMYIPTIKLGISLPFNTNLRSSLSNWQGGASVGLYFWSKALRSPASKPGIDAITCE